MAQTLSIVWFKRDLRIHDHVPLATACAAGLPVLPLYVIEPDYWRQPFASRRHWHFIHDSLVELRADCARLGQPLVVRTGTITNVFDSIRRDYAIDTIYAHEETSNLWGYQRDEGMRQWCCANAIRFNEYPTNGIVRQLRERDGWAQIRNQRMAAPLIPKPDRLHPLAIKAGQILAKDDPLFGGDVPGITQLGGRRAAIKTLHSFLIERCGQYLFRLSAPGPSEIYCSRLSAHLTWGTLSAREVVKSVQSRRAQLSAADDKTWERNLSAFASRLSWRCHFIQKIEDQPKIETDAMHPAFRNLPLADNEDDLFAAWSTGRTGYPFIDACMRNLIHEGWITFRIRAMLVSFASYHLGIDWRRTGHFLARLFTDYEPGIHYSQIQMQSGITGINAVRIYNPIKQSMDHDPDGVFIQRWVPELQKLTAMWIHEPAKMDVEMQRRLGCVIGQHYPAPIVDHRAAVQAARARLSTARKTAGFRDDAKKIYDKLGSRRQKGTRKAAHKKSANARQLSFFDATNKS